ncbi:CHAD domain-containing protein [Solihabitans fulvus]|uniref:CHAD domain-containing protein n=1 Tax=Solihabitans fulvus TaxID=1892852 RepID=A0A5B2XJK0_9PSEU|nr:CHAD domain-containing protein [Solihabitans fulvus]KAA2264028.1 CHAD domain-containing protein [Solihabitans fulvus]
METGESTAVPQLVRAAVRERLAALRHYEDGAAFGDDPEDLHQMRVAVRRLRAVLAVASDELAADWAAGLRAELRWLGQTLGPVRDADVLLDALLTEAAGFPPKEQAAVESLLATLRTERKQARKRLRLALRSPRYTRLLRSVASAEAGVLGTPDAPPLHILDRPLRALRRAVDRAGEHPSDEALHEIRIKGKRLRYTAELVAPVGGKAARELVAATRALQEVLGAHQDSVVAEAEVRRLLTASVSASNSARRADATAFVAGRLVERACARRSVYVADWPAAWTEVDRRARLVLGRSELTTPLLNSRLARKGRTATR